MDNFKIVAVWEELEEQKCKYCIFFNHCDILTNNYKNDICKELQNKIESMEG